MSNSIKKHPSLCSIGDVIKFVILSPYDTTTYSGEVTAIADFDRARPYGDILATYSAISKGAALIQKELIDPKLDTYLVVRCTDGIVRAIGYQWIEDELVELTSTTATQDIRLFHVTPEKAAQAISILRNSGFICKVVPT